MLKRTTWALGVILMLLVVTPLAPVTSTAHADQCSSSTSSKAGTVSVGVSCELSSGGSEGSGTGGDAGGAGASGGESGSAPVGCFDAAGTEVACWSGDLWWSDEFQLYCHGQATTAGTPGSDIKCEVFNTQGSAITYWVPDTPTTPVKPDSVIDPVKVVTTMVTQLGLHTPTVGVGAYVYPQYPEWGLSWWVGAPLWLWVDATDPLQWGTHTLTATESGLGITATVTTTSVTTDPGDGSTPVVCDNPGTPRPWNPDELMSDHSPSGCEHTYTTINTKGDKTSRFTVTMTTTWQIDWVTTDNQSGTYTLNLSSTTNPAIHVGQITTTLVTPPH